jgi:chemotaxis protein methyltransferase CheR
MTLDIVPFKALIKARCGLLIEGHAEEKLTLALAERHEALAVKPVDYYARLSSDEAEFQELVNLLTINETYFFREPEQIRLLVDRLAPRFLVARDGRAPVRILSAGCSSGEEPYSLVMALMDKYGESVSRLFTFTGGDIDSTVLAKARHARYGEFSFRGVPASVRCHYFDKNRESYALKPQVKNLVSFHELNLLADSQPPALCDFDIIFFRNVSIYFDTPTRKVIQQNLASLMKDDGVLVIGTAETLANDLGVLSLVEDGGLFYFVKKQPPLPEAPPYDLRLPLTAAARTLSPVPPEIPATPSIAPSAAFVFPDVWRPPEPVSAIPQDQKPTLDSARQLTRDHRYDEALPRLDSFLAIEPDNREAQLLKAHALINRKDFAAAEELAQGVLARDAWSVDALLLLGLAAKWRQQNEMAIRWFKQAVYAHHECWPAHYYLADLYRNSGHSEGIELARRAYRVVIQLLSGADNTNDEKGDRTGIKHVPLELPVGEIRFLCEHQLGRLPAPSARVGER